MPSAKELGRQANEVLEQYYGLRLMPAKRGLRIGGTFHLSAETKCLPRIEDEYELRIDVPPDFPQSLPTVRDTGSRIPASYHTNPDGTLCLGSPVRQLLAIGQGGTIIEFIERVLVPYLYGYSHYETSGELPFGELDHGTKGLMDDYARLFGVQSMKPMRGMIALAAQKKRIANKQPCPCGSGLRLGRCHNRSVNYLRDQLGRNWFVQENVRTSNNSWGTA